MMTSFHRPEFEPPHWFYVLMARGPLLRRIYCRFVADLAEGVPPQARLLDVGAGPGYLLGYLSPRRPDIKLIGLDPAWQMVRGGRRQLARLAPGAALHSLVGQAQTLPIREAAVDRVVVTFSFHIWPNPARGLTEIMRVLQPGGRAWIYEMQQEATTPEIRAFAREENLPFPLVFLGFKVLSYHHSLKAQDFAAVAEQAGIDSLSLEPAHRLFWRAEFSK